MDEGLQKAVQGGGHALLVVRIDRDGNGALAGREPLKLRCTLMHGGVHVAVRAVRARRRDGREDVLLELEALQDPPAAGGGPSEQAGEEEVIEVLGEFFERGWLGVRVVQMQAEEKQEVVSGFLLRWEEGLGLKVGPGPLLLLFVANISHFSKNMLII